MKRLFDITAAVVALLLLCLPLLALTLLVAAKLGRPAFFRQVRPGLHGKPFEMVKFRTMRTDAERLKPLLEPFNEMDGPAFKMTNDPRVTPLGRFLRRTSLDELPQLWNILHGDMSFVGPRPERPQFVDMLANEIRYYDVRHSMKPGLTGWAQIRYSYGASVDDARRKLQFDLYYVKNNSLVLDTLILAETVRVVLFGEGAH